MEKIHYICTLSFSLEYYWKRASRLDIELARCVCFEHNARREKMEGKNGRELSAEAVPERRDNDLSRKHENPICRGRIKYPLA